LGEQTNRGKLKRRERVQKRAKTQSGAPNDAPKGWGKNAAGRERQKAPNGPAPNWEGAPVATQERVKCGNCKKKERRV